MRVHGSGFGEGFKLGFVLQAAKKTRLRRDPRLPRTELPQSLRALCPLEARNVRVVKLFVYISPT